MKVYLVRHGQIPSNIAKVYAGWAEEALTETGIEQARQAGELLQGKRVEAIYSSPLRRTLQTAQFISERLQVPVIQERRLIELKMGPWEGLSEEAVGRQYPDEWKLWNARPAELRLPGRESLDELQGRMVDVLECVKRTHQQPVVLVTHVALVRVALLHLRHAGLNDYKKIHVPNAEPIEIEI